jgi:glycosyltransferase involved in cell wall biosynthesis
MKVSIIISCHRESPYLKEAIWSAIKQDFEDYEIILSSDGWDGVKAYAKEYGLEYNLTKKGNTSTALNSTVKIIKGEWFKELHHDDMLLPNCLKDLWEKRDGSLVYANAFNFWQDNPEKSGLYKSPPVVTWDSLWPPFKGVIHGGTLLTKTSDFLELGGYDETLLCSEEYDYYLNLLSHGRKLVYVDSTVMRYRRHPEQKTATYQGKIRKNILEYITKKYDNWNSSTANL